MSDADALNENLASLIYGARISPYVRKVCVFAREKGLAYRTKPAGPGSRNPEFLAISPFGKIPVLRDGDFTLADSSAIVWYWESQHPTPALIPAEPRQRAQVVWFDEVADTIISAAGIKVMFHHFVMPRLFGKPGDEAVAAEGRAALPRGFAYLEAYLENSASAAGWLVGGGFTLADIAVAAALRSLEYADAAPSPADYPALTAWYHRVMARPAWAEAAAEEASELAAARARAAGAAG